MTAVEIGEFGTSNVFALAEAVGLQPPLKPEEALAIAGLIQGLPIADETDRHIRYGVVVADGRNTDIPTANDPRNRALNDIYNSLRGTDQIPITSD